MLTSPLVPRASVVPAEGRGDRDRQWGTSWHLASQVEQVLGICAQYAKRFGAQTPLLVAGQGGSVLPSLSRSCFLAGHSPQGSQKTTAGNGLAPHVELLSITVLFSNCFH